MVESLLQSPSQWIKRTNATGIISKGGRYSIGTFAHPDIAFEFASWLSPKFKLCSSYCCRKNLYSSNSYRAQKKYVYTEEADVLNVALFVMTAKEWRDNNPKLAKDTS